MRIALDEGSAPIRAIAAFAVDLIYPKRCAGCGQRGSWLCQRCDAELVRFAPPWCDRCGVPKDRDRCDCGAMPLNLDRVRSVAPYEAWLRRAIIECKYHGEWARAEPLGQALATVVGDLLPCDGLVPVPLHEARTRQRGFNQSVLLAKEISTVIAIPVLDVLSRVRRTPPQVHLNAEARAANVHNAFALSPGQSVQGQSLLLVDDVMTTGATLSACALALIGAGAERVTAATVARDRLRGPTNITDMRPPRAARPRMPKPQLR